ncbi:MAG TPA: XdhC family protein [Syntrophales bacterium]|jgi:xanthine dehydrogenase accessory factor|nr:XdhC family protein [Syntrophales bacterium]
MQKRINELLSRGETFCLATVIESPLAALPSGSKTIILRNGEMEGPLAETDWKEEIRSQAFLAFRDRKKKLLEYHGGMKIFFDILMSDIKLLICGAGHIAVPLARFARDVGFYVIVVDDRPDFAHPSRFPECEVIAEDFIPALRRIPVSSTTFCVVITRGHEHDAECLQEILGKKSDAAYVGLIGSSRRVRFVVEMLSRQGIRKDRLDNLFTPIGLPIGAESPEEIAVSILGEMVCVRKKGPEQARLLRRAVGVGL